MKKYILLPLVIFFAGLLLSSCKKEGQETKYITLNEIVNSGSTYTLEPAIYGDADDVASITTQAAHFSVSQIDLDPATAKSMYHFSIITKVQDKETVVITLKDNHGGRGRHCDHDPTVITINLTVE
ncbi:MAG: hypothetical protein ABI666_06015 [Ferruginibacter sp.]